ncbi:hypothetical protein [Desulfoluna spongiiphila]|uniref:hypothetical protein n=1 Tax=Desulfoluna spongiiphila TaxID=419481 RepID=UPI00125C28AF|nr:hypothetical protein [Desulfoluna spongiiphila]VVS91427.1 hypothetical protein DBB_9950 [Desulfoluna spongiiphila]
MSLDTLIIIIVVFIVVVALARSQFQTNQLIEAVDSGWIQISNANFTPMFYGKIVGGCSDHLCLIGVLLESSCPNELVLRIKKQPVQRVSSNKILVRAISNPNEELVLSEIDDEAVISEIGQYFVKLPPNTTPIGIGAESIYLFEDSEALNEFEEQWQNCVFDEQQEQAS